MMNFCGFGKVMCLLAGFALISTPTFAAGTQGNVSAVISSKITITEDSKMNFAKISVDSSAQTIALSNTGEISCPSQYECSGDTSTGTFIIDSTAGQILNIKYTNGLLTGPGEVIPLKVDGVSAPNASSFVSSGSDVLNVGAELEIGDNAVPGLYSGAYVVNVNY